MGEKPRVMSPTEVAEYLQITEAEAIAVLESGRIKGFQVGKHWRTTEQYVLDMINSAVGVQTTAQTKAAGAAISRNDDIEGVPTLQQLQQMTWRNVGGFQHNWPQTKDAPVDNIEMFDEGYEASTTINDEVVNFVIGFSNRQAAGMKDRRRAVIFKGRVGQALYPLVEFAGANDFATSGTMVSIIRMRGRVPVKPGDILPDAYQGMPTGVYKEIVVGPYAWNCIGVVAHKTDFHIMVRHAALRMFAH